MSFTDYLTAVRMDQAKRLLKETNLKMYEIAEMIGYSNITYFNRIFKKTTGLTPAQFRSKSGV